MAHRRGRALRRRYGRAVHHETAHGTRVRILPSHGYAPYRGLTGRIDKYVPFSKFYVNLDRGDRIFVDQSDLEVMS